MASGTRLARLKKLEDDSASKHKTRKLDKVNSKALSDNKLVTVKKIPESPLRRSSRTEKNESSINTNSKKHVSTVISKSRKEEGNVGSSSNLGKAKKRKMDGKVVSSSTDDSTVSASPIKKNEKVDAKNIYLESNYTKSKDNGKRKIRKHLHVRTYKKLIKRQASNIGSQGVGGLCLQENCPLRVFISDLGVSKSKEDGNTGNNKGNVHDKGNSVGGTKEPLDKEDANKIEKLTSNIDACSPCDDANVDNGTKLSSFNNQRTISYDILGQSPEKRIARHSKWSVKIESPPSILEEHGVGDFGVHYDACPEATSNNDSQERNTHTQTATDLIPNTCSVCKQPGQLMGCFGKGCQRSYHLSCLGPLLPGAWLCTFCVKKKVEFGVYSVSEGIESVWDIDEGVQSGKHYFVKYKGLSHAHNRWIPENQLLHDAPLLLAKFRKKGLKEKVTKWRKKWVEPERLLQKRLVVLSEAFDECTSGSINETSNCCIEWFVKWKGLEYDQATWELEKSLLHCSSEAGRLIEDYEHRRELARNTCASQRVEKAQRIKKEPFYKLTGLPDGCPIDLGHDILGSLNCLREFWHRSVNAVLIDDQERFSKSILFVLALQCHACRPSLFLTTSSSLTFWQAEFVRLAPSLNVVTYQGDKDVRRIIKNLEFYEESGCLMFQVLLADYVAFIEDFGDIACIDWEAVVIDKCEKSNMSRYLEQLKSLNTYFKLLLFNDELKDNLSEYHILLSLLSTEGTADDGLAGRKAYTNEAPGALAIVKEKLAHHIAYECKADSSIFVEYWVPVPFSNVQLEQYCATFISNSSVLRSNLKSDVFEALHNILITARKCCDHPYLVDGELRGLLTKDLQAVDFLNAEVRASGKLFLLDKILQEMKSRELRVVILFQSLGPPGKVTLGDILDDFLQQRFGVDSYERIEYGLIRTKRLASLEMFNNKDRGRFVFLIEKRACVASVKLQFVDAIILFDSDWNPVNDLRSLQKINIESQHNCIKVFRLYTSFTVEERLLMFSKQNTFIDSRVENISRNICHSLLGWGASYLFKKLDQFHSGTRATSISEPSFDKLCLSDVILEILSEISGKPDGTKIVPHSILIKAQQCGTTYSGNIVLVGEKDEVPLLDKDAPFLWPGLLEGRYPRWIHISDRSQRIRRKVHNVDGFVKRNEAEGEVQKKRRKTNIGIPVPSLEPSEKKNDSAEDANKSHVEFEHEEPKLEEQRNLLMLLKPELSKLCDILGLPSPVIGKAQEFLSYIMGNHDVCSKQVTVLQALKISLCWRAASMSRHRLDRVESLQLARKHLKFECTDEEAYSVYSRLRILKEKFPFVAAELDTSTLPNKIDSESDPPSGRARETEASDTSNIAVREVASDGRKELVSAQKGQIHGTIMSLPNTVPLDDDPLKNQFDLVEKVFLRRSEDLSHKQHAEILNFEKTIDEEKVQLEQEQGLDLEFVRSIHIDLAVVNGKINLLTREYSNRMGRFFQHLKQQKEELLSMQLAIRNKEHKLKQSWLIKVKTGQLEEPFDNIPLPETGFKLEKFKESGNYVGKCDNSGTITLNPGHPSDKAKTELVKRSAESIESEECCPEVQTNTLNGSVENLILSDETYVSRSVMTDNMRPIEHSTSFIKPSVLPVQTNVMSRNDEVEAQLNVLNQFSRQSELVNTSIMSTSIDTVKQGGRDNINEPHPVANPGLDQEQLLANTSSAVQEIFTNEHVRQVLDPDSRNKQGSTVTLPLSVESMPCNDATPLRFTDDEQLSSSRPNCSSEQTEVQYIVMDLPILEIPENDVHLQRPPDLLSESSPSVDLRAADIHQGIANDDSFYSAQQTMIQGILSPVMRIEPSNQQSTDDNLNWSRSQEDPPTERAPSEHLRGIGVPTDQVNQLLPNFLLSRWIHPQVFCADPFQNELIRIRKQDDLCAKTHEHRKLQIQLEREIELEKVKRKYDTLLQHAERECFGDKTMFQEIYDKVFWHKVFAEEVRSKFYDQKDGASTPFQGSSQNLAQQLQSSLSQPSLRPSSVSAHIPPPTGSPHPATSNANQESTAALLTAPRPRSRIPSPSIHSTGSFSQSSPALTSNIVRGLMARASLPMGRAPAPHLQRFRPNTLSPTSNPAPVCTAVPNPSFPSSDFGSSFPTTFGPSLPVNFPQELGADHVLESLLSNLPSTNNEFPSSNMFDSRPNESPGVICLSDDE